MKKLLLYFSIILCQTAISQTYTFTNCGATGRFGPTQADVNTEYVGTNLENKITINTQGYQEWIVPASGEYSIKALGANGGYYGGFGAKIEGSFFLIAGQKIIIAVGQSGTSGEHPQTWGDDYRSGGGGGGSFVVDESNNPIIIAGGGGGGGNTGNSGSFSKIGSGGPGLSSNNGGNNHFSSGGGTDGSGGLNGVSDGPAAGGAGFYGDGQSGNSGSIGGKSWQNGLVGGLGNNYNGNYSHGGFGGGGGSWNNSLERAGGGGGYSGGQGGSFQDYWNYTYVGFAGGGGSYNSGNNQVNQSGVNNGHGRVEITAICPISQQTLETDKSICPSTSTTIQLNGSEAGVTYTLKNKADDSTIDGPENGTGNIMTFTTGNLSTTTNFYITAINTAEECSIDLSDEITISVLANTSPVISAISNFTSCPNSGSIPFTITDEDAASVSLQATSSNTTLIPNPNITLGGAGANRTIQTQAVANQTGTATITITATDNCGETDTETYTVTVKGPHTIANQPQDLTIAPGGNGNFSVTVDEGLNLSYQWQVSTGGAFSDLSNNATYGGVNTATLSITSATLAMNGYQYRCKINSDCAAEINSNAATLTTNTPPVVSAVGNVSKCPSANLAATAFTVNDAQGDDVTITATSNNQAVVKDANITINPSGSTGTPANATISISQFEGLGTATITISANDGYANGTTTFDVVIEDGEKPTITCPGDKTKSLNLSCETTLGSYITDAEIIVSDNCTPTANIVVSQSEAAATVLSGHNDVQVVTLIAEDIAGNTESCTFNVTAKDVSDPNAASKNIEVQLDVNGEATITAAQVNNNSSDNCTANGDLILSLDKTSFTCADLGDNTVELTVEDLAGNESQVNATVTVTNFIEQQTFASTTEFNFACLGEAINITLNGSQTGVNYSLYNANGDVVSSAVAGNNGAITLVSSDTITLSGNYGVKAVLANDNGCELIIGSPIAFEIAPCQVKINEVDYDQPGTDDAEFIELYNADGNSINLDDWSIDLVRDNGSVYKTIALPNAEITSGGYYVICANSNKTLNCNFDVSPNTNLIQNGSPDAMVLRKKGSAADRLSYEGSVAGFVEDTGVPTSLSDNNVDEALSLSRIADGIDTDDNSADFKLVCATPGVANVDQVSLDVTVGTPIEICEGEAIQLACANEPGSYNWSGPSAYSSFIKNPYIGNAAVSRTGDYTVEFTNVFGCKGTAIQNVVVQAEPEATIDVSAAVCEGGTIQLSATGGDSYAWSGPNGFSSTDQNPLISDAGLEANGTYTVVVTNAATCEATLSIDATVNPNPDLTITYSGNTCTTKDFQLIGNGADSYEWTGPNGFSSTNRKPIFYNADLSLSGTYYLEGENEFGCVSNLSTDVTVFNCEMVINEVEYDSPNAPDTQEFIELKSISDETIDLGEFSIELINGSGNVLYDVINLPSQILNPGEYFVICGNDGEVDNCDYSLNKSDFLQNGSPDAIRLLRNGIVVDVLSYEGKVASAFEGQGNTLVDDGSLITLSRIPDGFDSQNNQNDFALVCPTPGLPNEDVPSLDVFITGTTELCPGENLTLTCTNTAASFLWNGPNGFSSTNASIQVDDIVAAQSGTYSVTISSESGCSGTGSVVVTLKEVPQTTLSSNSPICVGASLELAATGAHQFVWSGPQGFTSSSNEPIFTTTSDTQSGTYNVVVTGDNNCITEERIEVVVNPLPTATATSNTPICEGGTVQLNAGGGVSFEWSHASGFVSNIRNPQIANAEAEDVGTYNVTVTDFRNCEAQATVNVIISPTLYGEETVAVCESYTWHGNTYSISGDYQETLTADGGCDSVATLHLEILPTYVTNVSQTVCGKLDYMGQTFTASGNYTLNTKSIEGCDSTILLNLTVLPNSYGTESIVACEEAISRSGKYTWTHSGVFKDTLNNSIGCDSVLDVTVTILEPTYSEINPAVCDEYISPKGQTLTSSGTYTEVITNEAGCDSIITINLTILNEGSSSVINATACDSYDSPSGNYTWTETGTYTDIIASEECNQEVTVNLVIKKSTSKTIAATSCGSYEWFGKTYNQSGTYVEVINNLAGCDSTITLNLEILPIASSDSIAYSCTDYTWNGKTYNQSGAYSETFEGSNGCDSIATLHLTISDVEVIDTYLTSCSAVEWRGNKYNKTGEYKETITNDEGCKTIFRLHLTIEPIDTTVTQNGNSLNGSTAFANYQWLDCDNNFEPVPGATKRKFTPTESGNYAVQISKDACIDTSSCHNIVVTEIGNLELTNNIQLYPNPTNGRVTLDLNAIYAQVEIEVRDALGKEVAHYQFYNRDQLNFEIDQAKGVYSVKLKAPNGVEKVWRVVKQ